VVLHALEEVVEAFCGMRDIKLLQNLSVRIRDAHTVIPVPDVDANTKVGVHTYASLQ